MFNWLGNLFPYSDLHSLNLDWILTKMKETAAQAAKAIADSASALAQVIEAKTAAQDAQTAAQNAQTAANNAQASANNAADSAENAVSVAQAAKSAAQTAQNTANTAQSAAQTAQNTANTAQSAAQTAQSAAETAQSAAQTAQNTADAAKSAAQTAQNTANTAQSAAETAQRAASDAHQEISKFNNRFPVKNIDIAKNAVSTSNLTENCVTLSRMGVITSYLYMDITSKFARFPYGNGSASIDQITAGIINPNISFLAHLASEYIQIRINITDDSETFLCNSPIVRCNNKATAGLVAIAPIIVIKNSTNDIYNGFIRLSHVNGESGLNLKCEVIFKSAPPFNNGTQFVIIANAVYAKLTESM